MIATGLPVSSTLGGSEFIGVYAEIVTALHSTVYIFRDFCVTSFFDTSSTMRLHEEEKYMVFGLQSVSSTSTSPVPK